MKKFVVVLAVAFSIISCKKDQTGYTSENDPSLNIISDSLSDYNSAELDSISIPLKNRMDSVKSIIQDTAVVKIQNLKEQKQLLTEKVAKTMDSASRTEIISEIKITQKKIDSVKNNIALKVKKRIALPRVIRETKVIYRDTPKAEVIVRTPKITKKGELEIQVDDLELAQLETKEQISKYDGTVKSEQILADNDQQYIYLKLNVALDKSDYLIKDLENNVGKITARNIETTGEQYAKNSVCNLEITLVKEKKQDAVGGVSKSFGGRSLGAVGSGWNVIQEIFLFILPFWPLYLICGAVYYFVKKRKTHSV